jgi:hypothetical protein
MKSRFLHLAMLVLGAAGAVLTFLGTVPKYAGFASGLLLLVTDAKKALSALGPVGPPIAILLLLSSALGCATTAKVLPSAKACEPSTDQESAIVAALGTPDQAAALAAVDALGFALCLAQRGVDEVIASLTPKPGTAQLALTAAAYSPVLDNARAWRAAHP